MGCGVRVVPEVVRRFASVDVDGAGKDAITVQQVLHPLEAATTCRQECDVAGTRIRLAFVGEAGLLNDFVENRSSLSSERMIVRLRGGKSSPGPDCALSST